MPVSDDLSCIIKHEARLTGVWEDQMPNSHNPTTTAASPSRRGDRLQTLERMIQLMRRLDGCAYCPRLSELARELCVCPRTVRRYLEVMSLAGLWVPPFITEYEREAES